MDIWIDFDKKTEQLLEICKNKDIYIWGYGVSGWFIEHILKRNRISSYKVIDKNPNIKAYRPYYIKFIEPEESILLLSFIPSESDKQYLKQLGFKENKNYMVIKKLYGIDKKGIISYERYLDCRYGLDITTFVEHTDKPSSESCGYHWGIDFSIMDMLSKITFSTEDSVFDFGCGKGGALLLFHKMGCRKIGG